MTTEQIDNIARQLERESGLSGIWANSNRDFALKVIERVMANKGGRPRKEKG